MNATDGPGNRISGRLAATKSTRDRELTTTTPYGRPQPVSGRSGIMGRVSTSGSGRWVRVDAERVEGWLARFADRHGPTTWTATTAAVVVTAADGCGAECVVPFPPLPERPDLPYGGLVEHVVTDRRVGVLLVRLGGYAVGVFEGTRLVRSKVGSRQVHGRSAAGGWSQQRFARRREGQVKVALAAAADTAVAHLLPEVGGLDAVVLGGDRRSLEDGAGRRTAGSARRPRRRAAPGRAGPAARGAAGTPATFRAVRIRVDETGH